MIAFNRWLVTAKYFNSKTHFNKYIKSLNLSKFDEANVIQYFKDMYQCYLILENEDGGKNYE